MTVVFLTVWITSNGAFKEFFVFASSFCNPIKTKDALFFYLSE